MERDSFIFYKSFYDSIKELDPKDQVQIYNAIFSYQFEGKLIELKGVCKSIFTLIIPQLEANNKRYVNGCRGGAPKGNQNATKKQPKNNQKATKKQPNVNDNDNVNENVNDNVNVNDNNNNDIYTFLEKNFGRTITPLEFEKIEYWLSLYEKEIIKYAINISILNNKKTINYINGILNNWKIAGYKTLEEVREDNKYKTPGLTEEQKNNLKEIEEYDWFEEEI